MLTPSPRKIKKNKTRGTAEHFSSPVIDALDAHIALLDEQGLILAVNAAWRGFAEENGVPWNSVSEGVNYLSVCDLASGPDVDQARAFAEGLRAVMKMKRVGFELEYPCHSPRQQRWFIGRVTRFEKLDKTRVVVTHENITGQKLAEMALRESEERFRQLSGGSFEGIIIHDEGKIINANEVFVAMFGYDLPELIGINALEFATPELREIAERHIRTGSEEPYEGVALRMDGSTFDVEVRSKNIPYKGRIVRVTAVVDITERKRIEKALRKNTISLSESQRIGKLGSWDWDIVDNSLSWSDEIYRIWGVGKDFLLNFENIAGMIHPDDRELNSKRIQEFLASQAKGEFEFRIICPDGTVKYIFQSIEVTRAPSGHPIRMFGIMQDITERKKAAKEVALLAHTIRSISECVSITDTEDKILFVNDAFLKTYGYTADELFGKSITVHRSPGSEPAAGKILPATLQGGWQGELVNRKKDGTEFPIALSTSVVSNEKGQPIALVGIATDITERKRAEEEVRESQQLLKGTLSSLLDALFIIDANTVEIIDCNPAASAIFGYTREEMVGKTTTFLHVNQATLDEFRQYLNSAVEEKGFLFLPDYRMRRKDASIFPTEHSVIPILDEKGKRSGWVSMVRDITERKQEEEALSASEARYRGIIEQSLDGIMVSDEQGNITTWNKSLESMTGVPECDAIGRPLWEIQSQLIPAELATPELLGRLRTGLKNVIASNIDWPGEIREQAIRCADGTRKIVQDSSFIIRTGTVANFGAIIHDITERKRAEESLRKQDERYKKVIENIFKFIPEGILVFTDKLGLFNRNKTFEDIVRTYSAQLGYTEQELTELIINLAKNKLAGEPGTTIRIPKKEKRGT